MDRAPWDESDDEADSDRNLFGDSSSDEEEADDAVGPLEAEQHLVAFLIHSVMTGAMPAKTACIVCFWAKLAGLTGPVSTLALSPDTASLGHFSRKLRRAAKIGADKRIIHIDCPGHSKSTMSRVVHKLAVVPPHEVLSEEVATSSTLSSDLAAAVRDDAMPPQYMRHPIAIASGFTATCISMYVDALPTTKRDGLLGFWFYNKFSAKRHLCAVLRKSRTCICGCRGWCSLYAIFNFFAWSFLCYAEGVYPSLRWDGCDWGGDELRAALAGNAIYSTGALCFLTGDWSDYCNTWGFWPWSHNVSPCLFCFCSKLNWTEDTELAIDHFPFRLMGSDAYEAACASCEVKKVLPLADRELIARYLIYDKRQRSSWRGRALKVSLPNFQLLAGDRVEPSPSVPDVALFETLPGDVLVTFWRANSTRTKHRNPLLNPRLGVGIENFLVDLLHTLFLGVMKDLAMHCIWELILCDAYDVSNIGITTGEELLRLSCMAIKAELLSFYRNAPRGLIATECQDFTAAMIGTRENRCLATKASETKGFFHFVCSELGRREQKLVRGDIWCACADSLRTLMVTMEESPERIAHDTHEEKYLITHIYIYIRNRYQVYIYIYICIKFL